MRQVDLPSVVHKARVVNEGKGKNTSVSGAGAIEAAPDTLAPGTPTPSTPITPAGTPLVHPITGEPLCKWCRSLWGYNDPDTCAPGTPLIGPPTPPADLEREPNHSELNCLNTTYRDSALGRLIHRRNAWLRGETFDEVLR